MVITTTRCQEIPVLQEIQETAIRRRNHAELSCLRDLLARSPLQDPVTESVRHWQQQFFSALNLNVDVYRIEHEFTALLQEILKDAISHTPLDEEPLLGSDGKTYSRNSLCLYLHRAEEPYKYRSPFAPHDATPFTTIGHPIAYEMVQWLKKRGALQPSLQVEQSYPPPPTERSERIRRIQEKQAQRKQQQEEQRELFHQDMNQMQKALAERVQDCFASIHCKAEQLAHEQLEKIDALEKSDQKQLEALQQAVHELERQATELEQQTEELRRHLHRLNGAIAETERDDIQLQIAINETRQAIRERDRSQIGSLFSALSVIGGCACATWAVQSALAATGASYKAAIIPLRQGAMGTISLNL